MKVIIAGSRTITDPIHVYAAVLACGWIDEITEVVSGKARGVDTLGEQWADVVGIPVKSFPVTKEDYRILGRWQAPKARNTRMAEYADALILVWDGLSGGSRDMKEKAEARGLRIYEHIVEVTP